MTVQTVQLIRFTGSRIVAWGREIDATCVVRNELNRWRQPWQVVRTMGSSRPHGLPYQPRPFPPGTHEITRVVDMGEDTVYWPIYIDTDATQELPVWELDLQGMYYKPTGEHFTGRGYGIHHARYRKGGKLVPSNTTLGCINIIDPDDARWLGEQVREAVGYKLHVMIDVPRWEAWEVS